MLNELIEEFRDKIDINDYFGYQKFEIAKEELISVRSNIVFLLGNPGSGKSFMLNYLKYKFPDKYILQTKPFIIKDEFEEFLLKEGIEHPEKKEVQLKDDDKPKKTILVDEAHLLNLEMLEFLRILSDKGNRVILGMHEDEGRKIAALPQFASRYTKIIELTGLELEDFEKYVVTKFVKHNRFDLLEKNSLKRIYKFTKGNFRLSKKFIFTALYLLDYAFKNSLKYKKIDNCIIEMTALELGLIK